LTAQKDFPTLIHAFARVRESHNARLLILGDGDERSTLETLVKHLGLEQDVSMPGFILNPYPFMVHAALFVLSSRWEGLPGVLIEALYCGVPVIATDCPSGPREILADGKYGRLVPVGDPLALSQAIEMTLAGDRIDPPKESWLPYETRDRSESIYRSSIRELGMLVNQHVSAIGSTNGLSLQLSESWY
jgi:glycosyltransferase involved in cell wall biosynthesis